MTDASATYLATLIAEALEPLAQAHEALSGSDAAWLDHAFDESHLRLMRIFARIETIHRKPNGRTAEDFARALVKLGWMIVVKPEFADGSGRWPLDPKYGPVPTWADDMSTWNKQAVIADAQSEVGRPTNRCSSFNDQFKVQLAIGEAPHPLRQE